MGRNLTRLFSVAASAALLLGAMLVAPAGAKESVDARIRRAIGTTQSEDAASFTMIMSIDADGESAEFTVEGQVSLRGESRGVISIDMSEILGVEAIMEERIIGDDVYVNFGPIFASAERELPSGLEGKDWVHMSLSDLPGGVDPSTIDPTAGNNPSSQLEALEGIDDARRVGRDDVEGVPTTQFRGSIDLRAALEQVPQDQRDELDEQFEQVFGGDPRLPVDVWLDDSNRIRRMKMEFAMDVPDAGDVSADVDMVMRDFTGEIEVEAPPADETVEFDEYLELLEPTSLS